MSDNNSVNELIRIQRENQELLKDLIELTKKRKGQERWKLILEWIKMMLWPLIIALSVYFGVAALKGFTSQMMETMRPTNIIEQVINKGSSKNDTTPQPTTTNNGEQGINLDAVNDLLKLLGN